MPPCLLVYGRPVSGVLQIRIGIVGVCGSVTFERPIFLTRAQPSCNRDKNRGVAKKVIWVCTFDRLFDYRKKLVPYFFKRCALGPV